MTLIRPQILTDRAFCSEKVNFKWDLNESPKKFLYSQKTYKIIDSINQLNHKATLGLACAISEWISWRMQPLRDTKDISNTLKNIENIWIGQFDQRYLNIWA